MVLRRSALTCSGYVFFGIPGDLLQIFALSARLVRASCYQKYVTDESLGALVACLLRLIMRV